MKHHTNTQESTNERRRILVVANQTVAGAILREAITAPTAGVEAQVFVVAPALNRRVRYWTSDDDEARRAAGERLRSCLEQLENAGLSASGTVGDCDPLLAIGDALSRFAADVIVIATHPEGRSNWLARGLVARTRSRFALPVVHIVVDDTAREEYFADRSGRPVEAVLALQAA